MTNFSGKIWVGTLPLYPWQAANMETTGYDLGIIERVESSKEVQLDPFEYPDTDAREQEYFDAAGSSKHIRISGSFVADTWALVLAWKETLEALVNGYTFDNAINLYLGIYIKDFFSASHHLWLERFAPPLLELDANGMPGLNVYPRPIQDSHDNKPVCITPESISIQVTAGESPNATYELSVVVRWEV